MDTSAVIQQLRSYCSSLRLVGGAADFAAGLQTVVNPDWLPAAFVMPLAEDADDNELQNALRQEVRERVAVIVEFDNTADRRGQVAANQIDTIKYAIFAALLNWRIDDVRAQKGLQYAGGRFIDMDRGRLWWQWEFELLTIINDEDGFQIDAVPLTDIRVNVDIDQQPIAPPVVPPVQVDFVLFGDDALGMVAGAEGDTATGGAVPNVPPLNPSFSGSANLTGAGAGTGAG